MEDGMRLKQTVGVLLAVTAAWCWSGTVEAYEETTVPSGGALTGTISLSGEVPRPKGYNLVTFPDPVYCGRISDGRGWRLLQAFQVGDQQGLRDVVVLIEGVERGKARSEERRVGNESR